MKNTEKITVGGLAVAMATVLMWLSKLIPSPWLQGGSITLASMVPIIAASIILGGGWGIICSTTYAFIQMLFGFYPPPVQNLTSYILVVLLDYILAYGVLGTAGVFYNLFGKRRSAIVLSGLLVTGLRYACHILSGVLIWGVYAAQGQSVLMYSVVYNGSFMLPEMIISTVALWFLTPFIEKRTK